ncbi:hypothetical protein OG225_40845 (plasmid) [Nocardia sp. NBC_01377]|uniref:hypothetical protein n=1 Tax=Nocardia sp. NBC_01377 TaxID=2903595 RepID=UPI002F9107EE
MSEVPARLHAAVFEHVFGAALPVVASYAAGKARYLLERLDPDMRGDFEDIAQDVLIGLTEPLPVERIRHWRAVLVQELRWRILHQRRARLAAKRHPGHRVGWEEVGDADTPAVADIGVAVVGRAVIVAALGAVADHQTRAVLEATFVIAADGSYCDVRTTAEAATILGVSREKVKRLRAVGTRELRQVLGESLDSDAEFDIEEAQR